MRVYRGGLQHTRVDGMGVLSRCCPSGSLHSVSDGGRVPRVRPGAGERAQKEQLETSEDEQKGERPWKLREEPDPRGVGLRDKALEACSVPHPTQSLYGCKGHSSFCIKERLIQSQKEQHSSFLT